VRGQWNFKRLLSQWKQAVKQIKRASLIFLGLKEARRNRGARFRTQTVAKVLGSECERCKTTRDLTLDHIKPRSLGGSDKPSNLQVLCQACNQIKGLNTIDYRHIKTGVLHVSIGERVKHG